jgi:glycosidase
MINLPRTFRRILSLCIASTLAAAPFTAAQTLARPGWVGSGITTDIWWKRAIIYEVNPIDFSPAGDSPIHGIVHRLDYIHSLGTDAILLTHLQSDPAHPETIDPTLGTLDDLDDLLRQASSRHLRVLIDLDPAIPSSSLPNVARFWLNRGIAGFHLSGTSDTVHDQATVLRTTTASYLGQRIIIADSPVEQISAVASTSEAATTSRPEAQTEPQTTTRPSHHAHSRSRRHSRSHSSSQSTSHANAQTNTQSTTHTQIHTALDTHSPQLLLNDRIGAITSLNAAAIRPILDDLQAVQQAGHSLPLLATDGPAFTRSMSRYADGVHDLAIAKLLATLLFTTRAESLIYYGQELGVRTATEPNVSTPLILWNAPPPTKSAPVSETYVPYKPPSASANAVPNAALEDTDPDSLLNWYRQLSSIHHDNATLATGTSLTINRDDQNVLVLVRKPKVVSASSPVLVLLFNLTAKPVQLSLKADTTKLGLRGSFLKTVLRSYEGMGTMHLEDMTLPAYGAYIGELRY